MRGRKDLVWIDHRGIAHSLRQYERWSDNTRHGTTWCGQALNLTMQNLRKLPATCMTCVVRSDRQ